MKKLLVGASLVMLSLVSFGQKVDLDKFNFTFEYRDLPRIPQSPDYRTFSVSVNASSNVRSNYGDQGLENAVNIEGWKRISGSTGHLVVDVTLGDLMFTSSQVTERVEVQKDKDGKETGRKYYYKAEANYTWTGKAAVKDFKQASVGSTSFGSSTPKVWTSSEYSTRREAADYYNNNSSSIRNSLQTEEVNTALKELSSWASTNYGFSPRKEYEILWILDNKKHPEFQAQKDNWESFKQAVSTVTADNISEETKAKFASVIKYFDEIPSRFKTDDKGDKKLRYASYYNKAKIYLYLDNPEAAIKEADALIANAYDEGDGKKIKKEADELIALFKKNNATTRHWQIDLSSATPPASAN